MPYGVKGSNKFPPLLPILGKPGLNDPQASCFQPFFSKMFLTFLSISCPLGSSISSFHSTCHINFHRRFLMTVPMSSRWHLLRPEYSKYSPKTLCMKSSLDSRNLQKNPSLSFSGAFEHTAPIQDSRYHTAMV